MGRHCTGMFREIADITLTVNPSYSMIHNHFVLIATLWIMVKINVSFVSTKFSCFCILEGTLVICESSCLSSHKKINICFFVGNIMWLCPTIINSMRTKPAYFKTFSTIILTAELYVNFVLIDSLRLISKRFVVEETENDR